jgi:hypothetical protein
VDETHPVDILEPEEEAPVRSTPDAITMIDRIGGSFLRGNPFIIQVAWSFLLNQQSESMQACAKKLGCTRQAISKQVARLANLFGYPVSNRVRLEMRRRVVRKPRTARKRRLEDCNPPAAGDDQSKMDDRIKVKRRASVNARCVNDSSEFTNNHQA